MEYDQNFEEKIDKEDNSLADDIRITYEDYLDARKKYIKKKANKPQAIKIVVGVIVFVLTLSSICVYIQHNIDYANNAYYILFPLAFLLFFSLIFSLYVIKVEKSRNKLITSMYNTFSLKDHDSYAGICNILVDEAVDLITFYGERDSLIELLEKNSPYISKEIYKLKEESKLSSREFVEILENSVVNDLLKDYINAQKAIAEEKAEKLLNGLMEKEDGSQAQLRIEIKTKINDILAKKQIDK